MHITTDPQALRLLSIAAGIAYGPNRFVRIVAPAGVATDPLVAALLAAIDSNDGCPAYVAPAGASVEERRFVLRMMTPKRVVPATHVITFGQGLTGFLPDAVIIDRPTPSKAAEWYAGTVRVRLMEHARVVVIDDGSGPVLDPTETWTTVEISTAAGA